jgi:hypothetical protein
MQIGFKMFYFIVFIHNHHSTFSAGKPIRIENKNLIDYIFLQSLEVGQSYDLPMQIHTG